MSTGTELRFSPAPVPTYLWKTDAQLWCSSVHSQHCALPSEMLLPRLSQVQLNRPHTSVGRFHSFLRNWDMATTATCECAAENQTADHIALDCSRYSPSHGIDGLIRLNEIQPAGKKLTREFDEKLKQSTERFLCPYPTESSAIRAFVSKSVISR